MRKNVLALSIAAIIGGLGLAGGANASVVAGTGPFGANIATVTNATELRLQPSGIGHILLVPYFTTQNGNATLLNIVNTDETNGKAVKVRFRGAANSDDVFDFQVYLSPGDVWAANISQGADGRSKLTTTDNSCTIPASVNASFVTDRLPSTMTDAEKAAQTREGYVEIFNMADIPVNTGDATKVDTLYDAIKHVNGVAPCGTQLTGRVGTDFTGATAADVEKDAVNRGFDTPSTGLMANWTIINVPEAASYSGAATAIAATTAGGAAARGNIVFFPQTAGNVAGFVANVTDGNINVAGQANVFTADPLLRTAGVTGEGAGFTAPAIKIANYDLPDLSTPYTRATATGTATAPATQALALTASITKTALINEFLTDDAISAATDWVFSLPTRRYSIALDYRAGATINNLRVTNDAFVAGNDALDINSTVVTSGQICSVMQAGAIKLYDRSEQTPASSTDFVISPGTPAAPLSICGETSVLSFNAGGVSAASVLGGAVTRKDVDGPYADGWAIINTVPQTATVGLPVLGQSFMKATNPGVAGGTNGNFGISFDHRFKN